MQPVGQSICRRSAGARMPGRCCTRLNEGLIQPGEEGQAEPGDGGGWPDEILGGGDHDDDDAMDHGAGDLQPQDQELDDEELMMMQYDDMVRLRSTLSVLPGSGLVTVS